MSLLSKVTAKPWEHAGELHGQHGEYVTRQSAGRTGLMMFLAVISSLFLLFMISYYTRSLFPDWEVLADPAILWLNTALLVLASLAMQLATNAARRRAISRMRSALLAAAVLSIAFIAGQMQAWDQLVEAGYYAQENPSYAFFYLVTGLHGVHLLGGLWFLGRLGFLMSQDSQSDTVLHRVKLSATYWHYLLLVWLLLFVLLLRT